MVSYPNAWQRFVKAHQTVPESKFADFSRFAARYRVATSFESVSFTGMAAGTQAGYTSAIRVALAYSTLEALGKATRGRGKLGAQVTSPDLAHRFHATSTSALRKVLIVESDSLNLRAELRAIDIASPDVTAIAASVRHLTLHGPLTASGVGLAQSAVTRTFLDDLAEAVLRAADSAFEYYLDDHVIGPWAAETLAACPSCDVAIGARHKRGCTIALCKAHGEQWQSCLRPGKHAATRYRGVFPGTVEALKRGWSVEGKGTKQPDLNRVYAQLEWNPDRELFE